MKEEIGKLVHELNLHLKEMVPQEKMVASVSPPLPPPLAKPVVVEKAPPPPPPPAVVEKKVAPAPVKEDWKVLLQKTTPDLKMNAAPPKDSQAKEEALLYRQNEIAAQILLLASGKGETLLQNLARALMKRGHIVKILDATKLGGRLDAILEVNRFLLVLAFQEMKPLLAKSKGNFLFLDDEETYAKDPAKKKKLWDHLCTQLLQKSS